MLKISLQFFGGRGASSGGGGSGKRTQADHMNPWNPPPSLAEQLAKQNGVDVDAARRQVKAVENYSGSDYRDIRRAQYENDKNSSYYEEAVAIEQFIAQSPKWAGGELYRGIDLPTDTVSALQVGGRIDMKGMSSWSTSEGTAKSFAKNYSSNTPVVFRTKGTKQGTSITHLSSFGKGESEVLVSGKATWTIKKISQFGGITYVDVSED